MYALINFKQELVNGADTTCCTFYFAWNIDYLIFNKAIQ